MSQEKQTVQFPQILLLLLYCTGGRKTSERDVLQRGACHDLEWKDLKKQWRAQREKNQFDEHMKNSSTSLNIFKVGISIK